MSTIGFWDWLASLFGLQAGAVSTEQVNEATEVDPETGDAAHFVVTSNGYRIRVPEPGALSHSMSELLPNVRQSLAMIPPLPHVVTQLLREVQDPHATAASVGQVAASDPALAAALLRTVNSSAMGLSHKINSVPQAVSYLGFSLVKSVLLKLRLDEALPIRGAHATEAEELWIHALATSYIAEAIAERVPGVDRGFVSTFGLMHDIGKLAMLAHFQLEAKLVATPGSDAESRCAREARVLGSDHAGLGASLAHGWGLPADLVRAIRFHHHPGEAFEASDPRPLRQAAYIVFIANQIAKCCYRHEEDLEIDPIPADASALLGIDTSMETLVDTKVQHVVTRAILFAVDSSKQTKLVVRPFLKIRRGEAARALIACNTSGPSDNVRIDDARITDAFKKNLEQPGNIRRGSARPSESDITKLISTLIAQQSRLNLPVALRGQAAHLVRALLPNLVEHLAGHHTIETVQMLEARNRLIIGIRASSLGLTGRLTADYTSDDARTLLQTEFACLLNLGWIESIVASSDGEAILIALR